MAIISFSDADWLEMAISQASTRWLRLFLQAFLPQLRDKLISDQEFALALDEELRQRRLDSPAQQKNYRSNVVQALKLLDRNHSAIALVELTTQQYRELNDQARGRLADRETLYLTSDQAERLVERATALLGSAEWSEVAAGLAVLIGRRISEILLSRFELHSPWSLAFSQMSKKRDEAGGLGMEGLTIEIPTLAPADRVLEAILRLQAKLGVEDIKREAISSKGAKQRVNSRFSEPVADRCVLHFSDLVPARRDRENLYTHIFRAVYASIAAHWFCPPSVPEHNFKAEIQGHFTLSSSGAKLPNYSARANYDDYAIGTETGNRDGSLGIKLGHLPGLEVLEVFRHPQKQEWGTGLTQEKSLPQQQRVDDQFPNDQRLAQSPATAGASAPVVAGQGKDGEELALDAVAPQRVSLSTRTPPAEVADGMGFDEPSLDGPFIDESVLDQPSLDQQNAHLLAEATPIQSLDHQTIPMSHSTLKPKSKTKRPEVYADDLDRLANLMLQRGKAGPAADLFAALLDEFARLAALERQHQHQQSQSLDQMTHTLSWFTTEVGMLRDQVATLQQERDALLNHQVSQQQLQQLQADNLRLQQELHTTQARLNSIQRALAGAVGTETIPGQPAATLPVTADSAMSTPSLSPTPALPAVLRSGNLPNPTAPTTVATVAAPAAHSQAVASTPVQQATARRSLGETTAKLNQIVDAIMSWNSAQDDPGAQLRISIPTIKALAAPMGASYQQAIQNLVKLREQELEQHHNRFLLGNRHNASVKNKTAILQTIARDFLSLDNWQTVKY